MPESLFSYPGRGRRLALLLLALLIAAAISGPVPADEGDPLFRDSSIIDVTLRLPISKILRERDSEDYIPGSFLFTDATGEEVELDVSIRARGNFRRENCRHPPLWLKFKKSQSRDTLFDKQKKLKLVVHCENTLRLQQAVLSEYLAYRLLNVITNRSFRVRLLRVVYDNTENDKQSQQQYAFLIEHKKRLAKRLDREVLEVERTSIDRIDGGQLNLTSIFQYFIGNTDFSPIAASPGAGCCHNYVLFGSGDEPVWSIPYDFDQSGFVNAPYSVPSRKLPIRDVRTRLYRGRCANNSHVEESLSRFRDKRDEIYSLINGQEGLSGSVRRRLVNYTDGFFAVIDDSKRVKKSLLRSCN